MRHSFSWIITRHQGIASRPRGHSLLTRGRRGGDSARLSFRPTPAQATRPRTCGVCAIDLTNGQVVALLRFETAVQEVFAVTVPPGRRYPELINDDEKLLENSFVVPTESLSEVAATVRPA